MLTGMNWQAIVIDFLWILGLAGLLATISFALWYRSASGTRMSQLIRTPRFLVPLCLSLEFFSIGMAAAGLVAFRPAPWWETIAWSIFVLLFGIQTILYGVAGNRYGWGTPVEGRNHERS